MQRMQWPRFLLSGCTFSRFQAIFVFAFKTFPVCHILGYDFLFRSPHLHLHFYAPNFTVYRRTGLHECVYSFDKR